MHTDAKSIEVVVGNDPRLVAGAGGVARYLGDAAGLEPGAIDQLQSAVVAVSKEAFQHLGDGKSDLHMTFTRRADRIEVLLKYQGTQCSAGTLDGVDSVDTEAQGSAVKVRIVKLLKHASQRM